MLDRLEREWLETNRLVDAPGHQHSSSRRPSRRSGMVLRNRDRLDSNSPPTSSSRVVAYKAEP